MILIDEDTQVDFMVPAGALYVPGAERLIPTLARLFAHVKERGIPVLSSVDAHVENDPEFAQWPAHCVAGTLGQQKVLATLLPQRTTIPNRGHVDVARYKGAPQVIVEKQTLDIFSNPNFERLLDLHPGEECAVIGVATDYCVRHVVEGLLAAGRQVVILTDGVRAIDPAAGQRLLDRAVAHGARLTTAAALLG